MIFEDDIKENIDYIRTRVEKAALKSGKKPEDIKIIAVTKTIEPERIIKAIDEGMLELGENRVQELCEKFDIINRSCNWHIIGYLQTNKVKYIIDKVSMIHSVDRLSLVQEIQKRAEKADKVIDVLIQVNVSGESSKSGIFPNQTMDFVREVSKYKNIKVKGLMTIAPLVDDPEDVREVFKGLRKIFIDISEEKIDNIDMEFLSMGMSNDFEIAIEEGANMIRVGTALFGKRQY